MNISPRRRQRALKVHELRQQGRSLRNIGKQLDISHTTVLADLKLIETHWSQLTQQSADDFLLEQFGLLQRRLRSLLQRDLLKEFGRLTPAEYARIHVAYNQELAILLRETRRLATQLHGRAELRDLEPGEIPQELDYPVDELTAAAKPPKSDKPRKPRKLPESTNIHHGLPKSSKPNHPNHPIPRKTLVFPASNLQKKISGQPPTDLTPEQLQQEAETFLRNQNRQDLQTAAAGA